MDIYFEDTMVSISVKTLVMATTKVIRGTTMATFDSSPVDKTWIFFFYKFKDHASPRPPCQYLITWVDIDSLDSDPARMTRQVIKMVTKAKQKAAKKLGVLAQILLPVENIIKVEDMEREIAEKDEALAEKDEALAEKDEALAEKDEALAEKDDLLAREREKNKMLAKENAELKKQLRNK